MLSCTVPFYCNLRVINYVMDSMFSDASIWRKKNCIYCWINAVLETHSSTFLVYSLWLEGRLQKRRCCWVTQQEDTIKWSSDYSTIQIPNLSSFLPPTTPCPRLDKIPPTWHIQVFIYLCPEYLSGHVTGRKDALFPSPAPSSPGAPPSLHFSAHF